MGAFRRFVQRLLNASRPSRAEADLDRELASHLQLLEDDFRRRGLSVSDAKVAARRALGGVARAKDLHRDARSFLWIDDFRWDLRYAFRTLRRAPGFAGAAVLTLAVGIGANAAIFSVADATLLNPLPFPHPDRLASVNEIVPIIANRPLRLTAPDLLDYEDQTHSFDGLAGWIPRTFELSGGRESERVPAIRASASLFRVLRVPPALGRPFTDEEDRSAVAVCVISDGLWQRWFGADPAVIGRVIHLDREPYKVVGVMPRHFAFPLTGMIDAGVPADVWVPLSLTAKERHDRADNWSYDGIARLKPAVTTGQASADVNAVAQHIVQTDIPAKWRRELAFTALVRPLAAQVSAGVRPLIELLFGAVACVLLVACVNVANLLLTRGAIREKELAVRVALGAGRARILRQLVVETLVIVVVAAGAGGLLAWWATNALGRIVPPALGMLGRATFNWQVLLFALGVTAATALFVGSAPAIVASTRLRSETLKHQGGSAPGLRFRRMRSGLVVTEVALAVVLLVGAGLLTRSFRDLVNASGGFQPQGAIAANVSLPATQYPDTARERLFYRGLHDRLRALPTTTFAGIGTTLPLSGRANERVFTPSDYAQPPRPALYVAGMTVVNSEYLQAIGTTLMRGRYFTPQDDAGGKPVAIVSQSLANLYWPGRDPIDRRVMWGTPKTPRAWLTVVGVVADVKLDGLNLQGIPQVYVPVDQLESSTGDTMAQLRSVYVVVRGSGQSAVLAAGLHEAVQSLDPRLAVAKLEPLDATRAASTAPERFDMLLMVGFAAVALLLAAIGIYGVIAYSVTQRTQEIGVRVALGADAGDVVRMVLRGAVGLALVGIALGAGAAAIVAPTLRTLLFGIAPLDVPTFAAVTSLSLIVAVVAGYIPSRRATRVDPLIALRSE